MAKSATKEQSAEQVPAISAPRLPFHPMIEERFGIDRASWKALVEAIFPGAQAVESVILALSYCRARKLDPFKRNVHIVPIWDSKRGCMVDTVWPGIGELRTTAFRTGLYAGRGATEFGPDVTEKVGKLEVTFPEWAQVTVYRLCGGQRVEFVGPRVYWKESYAVTKRDDPSPNAMWRTRPRGQIDKCAEAAALRAAFPEEIGNEYTDDEAGAMNRNPLNVIDAAPSSGGRRTLDSLADAMEQAPEMPAITDRRPSPDLPGTEAPLATESVPAAGDHLFDTRPNAAEA